MNIYEVLVVSESRDVPNYIRGGSHLIRQQRWMISERRAEYLVASSVLFIRQRARVASSKLPSLPNGNRTNGFQEKGLLLTSEYLTWRKRDWEFPTAKLAGPEASGKTGRRFDEVRYLPLKESIMENSPDHPGGKGTIMWSSCHCQFPLIYSPTYPAGRDFDWSSQAIPSLRDPPSLKEINLL